MSALVGEGKGRALCLHGFATCAKIYRGQMAGVIKRLDAMGISTDFPDAPFEADIDPNSGMYQMLKYFFPDDPNLKWMRATMLHADGTEEPCQNDDNMKPLNKRPGTIEGYRQVDKAVGEVMRLMKIAEDEGNPYTAIIGFSQGANLAAMMSLLAEKGYIPNWKIKCIVVLAGGDTGWRKQFESEDYLRELHAAIPECPISADAIPENLLIQDQLTTPSLHIVGNEDSRVKGSKALAFWFDRNSRFSLAQGPHQPPKDNYHQQMIADFVNQHLNGETSEHLALAFPKADAAGERSKTLKVSSMRAEAELTSALAGELAKDTLVDVVESTTLANGKERIKLGYPHNGWVSRPFVGALGGEWAAKVTL